MMCVLPLSATALEWVFPGDIRANMFYGNAAGLTNVPAGRITSGTNVIGENIFAYDNNGLFIDSTDVGKAGYTLGIDGVPHWDWLIFPGEAAQYIYLYNYEAKNPMLVVSESDRFGINKRINIADYHTYTAIGTDEMESHGEYTAKRSRVYRIVIDGIYVTNAGPPIVTTDTFRVESSFDNNTFITNLEHGMVGTAVTNVDKYGYGISFGEVRGHSSNDTWYMLASAQLPQSSLTVAPRKINEFLTQTNRAIGGTSSGFNDVTFSANSHDFGNIPLIVTTNSAFYIGTATKANTFYFNLITNGISLTMVYEYWNGEAWTTITTADHDLTDHTTNFTTSGDIYFNNTLMAGWTKTNITVGSYVDEYYWIRAYSTTDPGILKPVAHTVSSHGSTRFAVYEAHSDLISAFYIDAKGETYIHDYPLTESTLQSFYWKFLATLSPSTIVHLPTNTPLKIVFSNELDDAYNIYNSSSDYKWHPGSVDLQKLTVTLTLELIGGAPGSIVGIQVILYENGTSFAPINTFVNKIAQNTEVYTLSINYPFKPSNATNTYEIYMLMTNIANNTDVALINSNRGNRIFGEKLQ